MTEGPHDAEAPDKNVIKLKREAEARRRLRRHQNFGKRAVEILKDMLESWRLDPKDNKP